MRCKAVGNGHNSLIRRLCRIGCLLVVILAACGPAPAPPTADPAVEALLTHYGPAMRPGFTADLAAEGAGRPVYTLDITLDVSEEAVRFSGTESVRVSNTSADAWTAVVFRLYANLPTYGADLAVPEVRVSGQPVTPALDETRSVLRVPLPAVLPPGQATTIDLAFQTTITPGRRGLYNQLSYWQGVVAAANFFPLLSVYQPESGWWVAADHVEGDAVFSETAFFDVRLTAPEDLHIASSGLILERTRDDQGAVTTAITAPLMRDFVVVASADFAAISEVVDGVRINVLSYDGENNARAALNVAIDSLQAFNAAFGPYPFAELDVVETPTAAGGIEYPGLVVIAESLWRPSNAYFDIVISHEVAHQWWYSLVGNDQMGHPWLDESLAQYAVVVYLRAVDGERAAQARLDWYRDRADPYRGTADDRPIGLPTSAYGAAYFDLVYAKGPLFFQALADIAGADTLLGFLQAYFTAYRYEVAAPADMLASFELSLGRDDLDGIFRNWVGEFPGLE